MPLDPSLRSGQAPRLTAALSDRYRLERELGQGGMATVYLAQDLKHDRKVAIKVLRPELAAVIGADRFLAEIKVTANLQHPNLLPLFDSGESDGFLYYAMPYVEGETLRARLERERQLPVEETIRLVTLLAGALDYAHARGVIHRDLKPENILLQAGQPVIADFGIALAVAQAGGARVTETGLSLGTPHYMSPEQASGDRTLDARSDQYALAAVTYEMLAGEPPHTGGTAQVIITRLMTEKPRSIRGTRPAVPVLMDLAIARALAKPPADRFPTCGALASALAATPATRSRSWLVATTAGLVVIALIVWLIARRGGSAGERAAADARSLAVLPFESVGGDTANAYFAEGIADELTTAFARMPGLRLAGRSAAARFRDRGAQEIGKALNVGAVLDGSVRRAGNRIRVSAELASGIDGRVLWKQTYERELKDVFAVQDDITRAIVAELQVQLGAGEAVGNQQGTSDLAAYDLYLRGLQLYRKRGKDLIQAEEVLRQSIARDSGFARAYATLASVLLVQTYFLDKRMEDVLPQARAAAERAVALSPGLAESHLALGHVHIEAFEWAEAESELRQAMALDPNRVEIPYRLGFMLLTSGRMSEAIVALQQAKAVDPFYPTASSYLGWALALSGRGDEGVAESLRAFDLDSTNEAMRNLLCSTYLAAGRPQDAATVARRFLPGNTNTRRLGFYAAALGLAGARGEAEAIVRRLEALPRDAWGIKGSLAYAYLSLGDTAKALSAMERAAAGDGDLLLSQVVSTSLFDPVRGSPRFIAVLKRFNLDPARIALQQKSPAP